MDAVQLGAVAVVDVLRGDDDDADVIVDVVQVAAVVLSFIEQLLTLVVVQLIVVQDRAADVGDSFLQRVVGRADFGIVVVRSAVKVSHVVVPPFHLMGIVYHPYVNSTCFFMFSFRVVRCPGKPFNIFFIKRIRGWCPLFIYRQAVNVFDVTILVRVGAVQGVVVRAAGGAHRQGGGALEKVVNQRKLVVSAHGVNPLSLSYV